MTDVEEHAERPAELPAVAWKVVVDSWGTVTKAPDVANPWLVAEPIIGPSQLGSP